MHCIYFLEQQQSGYDNAWDGDLNFECADDYAVTYMRSVHDNHREDRLFDFECSRVVYSDDYPLNRCFWTGFENEFDQELSYVCPTNYVLTGLYSTHNNHREDRRWKFQCCKSGLGFNTDCTTTGYLNNFDEFFAYSVGSGRVFVGMHSYHSNRHE